MQKLSEKIGDKFRGIRVKCTLNKCKCREILKKVNKAVDMEDYFIISGLSLIVIATFKINIIAALYCLGFILFALGVFFAVTKKPQQRRR